METMQISSSSNDVDSMTVTTQSSFSSAKTIKIENLKVGFKKRTVSPRRREFFFLTCDHFFLFCYYY